MAAAVPLIELRDLYRGPEGATAPKVARGLPQAGFKTAASSGGPDAKILAVFSRESDGSRVKKRQVWLLQLEETHGGSYEWADFRPWCKRHIAPVRMRGVPEQGSGPCPDCGGRGRAAASACKCFHFECPLSHSGDCPLLEASRRPVYRGSHPYFGGYAFSEGWLGTGTPLIEYTGDAEFADWFGVTCHIDSCSDGSLSLEAYLLSDESFLSRHVTINLDARCVLTSAAVEDPIERDTVSGALLLASFTADARKHSYQLVQASSDDGASGNVRFFNSILHRTDSTWSVHTVGGSQGKDFDGRLCKVSETLVVGLGPDGLWALDLPAFVSDAVTPVPVAELAEGLSWRQVLRLPCEQDSQLRLLACGPEPNQAVIFTTDGLDTFMMRPRLLVEFQAAVESSAHASKIRHLTSVLAVPRRREAHDTSLNEITSVVRVAGSRSGYLLFNSNGDVFHLRDEAIVPAYLSLSIYLSLSLYIYMYTSIYNYN